MERVVPKMDRADGTSDARVPGSAAGTAEWRGTL